ncbi:hypothetical protein PtB15_4B490 [Puccinia triticina]|nr:hypothetical protein PtB15_4B490 [Puccinia triticina]
MRTKRKKTTTVGHETHWQKEYNELKRWDWLDLSATPRRLLWALESEEAHLARRPTRRKADGSPDTSTGALERPAPDHHLLPKRNTKLVAPADDYITNIQQLSNKVSFSALVHPPTGPGGHPANFVSSNIYLRPLPSTFTPLALHKLCMSMVRRRIVSSSTGHHQPKLLTLDPAHSSDHSPAKELLAGPGGRVSSPNNNSNDEGDEYSENENFRILSVKVMPKEEDQASLGACKGT